MPQLTTLTGPTIAVGASLSNAMNISSSSTLLRLNMPDAWDDAVISFQFSPDGLVWRDLLDGKGRAVKFVCKAGTTIIAPDSMTKSIIQFRIRSGTLEKPVNQSAQRVFSCVVQ